LQQQELACGLSSHRTRQGQALRWWVVPVVTAPTAVVAGPAAVLPTQWRAVVAVVVANLTGAGRRPRRPCRRHSHGWNRASADDGAMPATTAGVGRDDARAWVRVT
jgi:hypothetical protein